MAAAAAAAVAAAGFVPRASFPGLATLTLPRSYYLGHHAAALAKMKAMLQQIDLVIECRDYRIPQSSRNPQLEQLLSETHSSSKSRIVVFTKHDLGWNSGVDDSSAVAQAHRQRQQHDELLRQTVMRQEGQTAPGWRSSTPVLFTTTTHSARPASVVQLLKQIKRQLRENTGWSLTGHRVLVAGMPNVGKSTLLNALRHAGSAGKGKAARTGAQPGITRRLSSAVKIVDAAAEEAAGRAHAAASDAPAEPQTSDVYLLDTPGVFVPYVPSARAMLHLALCGCVKDGLVPAVTLADYLLYRLNLLDPLNGNSSTGNGSDGDGAAGAEAVAAPRAYAAFTDNLPTNSVLKLLEGVARRTGRLGRSGALDVDAAADWFVQRWRAGLLEGGRFVLEGAEGRGLGQGEDAEQLQGEEGARAVSLNQARKRLRERRAERAREKRS